MTGPLHGVRIIEMGGMGPGPFAGMMLADHGAEVIRIDRLDGPRAVPEVMLRSRQMVRLDLKQAKDVEALTRLIATADGLIEGFRPGTMERMGLGPESLCQLNQKLIYGRITGWGQSGPNSPFAGHDINYIGLSGAAHISGPQELPHPPPALIGDMGGGMIFAFSVVSALLCAQRTGAGQVIDCAMSNGSALLMTMIYGLRAEGNWTDIRVSNLIDGGAHFYGIYKTLDNKFVALGAIEPQFYEIFLERMGLSSDAGFERQMDTKDWPALRERLTQIFLTRTRAQWCDMLEHSDSCFAPVLDMNEAPDHPQNIASGMFITLNGVVQPAPAPGYSLTPLSMPSSPARREINDFLD